ncbi:MAG: hypothetical protein ABII12_11835 [Planctomycetota bacterium]
MQLLPRVGLLGISSGIALLVSGFKWFLFLGLPVVYFLVAWTVVRAADVARGIEHAHRVDVWICRLSSLLVILFFGGTVWAYQTEGNYLATRWWPDSGMPGVRAQLAVILFLLEIGVIVCTVCVLTPNKMHLIEVVWLWKIIGLLLWALFVVAFTILGMMSLVPSSFDDKSEWEQNPSLARTLPPPCQPRHGSSFLV